MSVPKYPIRKMHLVFVTCLALCSCVLISACHRSSPSVEQQEKQERILGRPTYNADPGDVGQMDSAKGERLSHGVIELQAVSARKEQGVLADEIKLGDQKGSWQTEAFHLLI